MQIAKNIQQLLKVCMFCAAIFSGGKPGWQNLCGVDFLNGQEGNSISDESSFEVLFWQKRADSVHIVQQR